MFRAGIFLARKNSHNLMAICKMNLHIAISAAGCGHTITWPALGGTARAAALQEGWTSRLRG
jgi:hypothetical protein